MKFFWRYLRQYRHLFLAALLFVAVFCLSFFLYHLPVGAVLYPAAICLFFAIMFIIISSLREWRRYEALRSLENCLPFIDCGDDALSELTVMEEEYAALVRLLVEQAGRRETYWNSRTAGMNEYYSVWVHQIKTPIAAMKLNLEGADSPEARRLKRDLQRIEQYVDMVMTYLRLESDSSDYVIREYELDDIVRGVIRTFAGEFIDRKLSLEFSGVPYKVVTDAKWLSFVIAQVVGNALKYTPQGSISIFLDGDELCIRDTGIGISLEDLPRVFENGYTGGNGRTDNHASGIGLYLSKRICARLNHTIRIESEPEKGTTVRIGLSRHDGIKE